MSNVSRVRNLFVAIDQQLNKPDLSLFDCNKHAFSLFNDHFSPLCPSFPDAPPPPPPPPPLVLVLVLVLVFVRVLLLIITWASGILWLKFNGLRSIPVSQASCELHRY